MATLRFILSSKGDRPKVTARLRISDSRKVQTLCKGVLAFRQFWSNAKQTHSTKFVNPIILAEVNQVNKTLADISSHVLARYAATQPDEVDKEWLSTEIDKVLHPEKYRPKGDAPRMLLALVDEFIAAAPTRMMPRKGKPVSAVTIGQYKQTRSQLGNYIAASGKSDIPVAALDKPFYDSFVAHLYGVGLKPNTIGKHIKNLKTFVNSLPLSQRMGVELVDKGRCATITEDVDSIYLTEEELAKIQCCELESARHQVARDHFILLAWTGCRYSDLEKLKKENVHTLDGGHRYFKLEQRKTGAKVTIPILPAALQILERYDYNPPRPAANQKFNEDIKEVCKKAGIDTKVPITESEVVKGVPRRVTRNQPKWKCVSAHTARRSFATNMYKRGFPTLEIMKITGHKTEKSFLKYIKVGEDENAERMMRRFMEQEFGDKQ